MFRLFEKEDFYTFYELAKRSGGWPWPVMELEGGEYFVVFDPRGLLRAASENNTSEDSEPGTNNLA